MRVATHCICCEASDLFRIPAVLAPFLADRIFDWRPVEITQSWGLRDIPLGMASSICNTIHCHACGALFLDMRFDDDEMSRLYRDYRGPDYVALRSKYEPGYAARNEALKLPLPYIETIENLLTSYVGVSPSVLDWGGDTGLNTPFAKSAKLHDVFDISGKQPYGRARNVSIETMEKEYNLIYCSQVLEHIPHPRAFLNSIQDKMTDRTTLYVDVPDEIFMRAVRNGGATVAMKRHWHEHVNFFTSDFLKILFGRIGLEVLSQGSIPIEVAGVKNESLYVIARKIPGDH